ncbi:alpha/beta fold hydrolase [Agromyces sp. NPDC058484]|uniref:alpha/beta fold hydrolase n=1 Tax=Agromyces sp. NPDC058484 TaxID=3346524 RepID=UPI0036476305
MSSSLCRIFGRIPRDAQDRYLEYVEKSREAVGAPGTVKILVEFRASEDSSTIASIEAPVPGDDVAPPQPMIAQTRSVLDRYAATGGGVTELELDDCGHSPHLEHPAAFREALLALIESADRFDVA